MAASVGSKTNKTLFIVVVVLLLAFVGVVVWQFVIGSQYYAVSLKTGDLYFGKLINFPSFGLKNVYLVQVNPQNKENPISVQKFTNVFWGPSDYLKINRSEVAWMTKLASNSQLIQLFQTNPNLLPQQGGQQGMGGAPGGQQPPQQAPPTSAPTPTPATPSN